MTKKSAELMDRMAARIAELEDALGRGMAALRGIRESLHSPRREHDVDMTLLGRDGFDSPVSGKLAEEWTGAIPDEDSSLQDRVLYILFCQSGLVPTLESHLVSDLGLDSLDLFELVIDLEALTGVELDDEELEDFNRSEDMSVAALIAGLEEFLDRAGS